MKIKHIVILIGAQTCATLVTIAVITRKIDQTYHRICDRKGWYYKDSNGKYHYL